MHIFIFSSNIFERLKISSKYYRPVTYIENH